MKDRILITGGGGFIGSHLTDEMLARGYRVRILDNLSPQIHGDSGDIPSYLSDDAEFILGDVRDPEKVHRALRGVDGVFHLAAAVGVGQSMYQIEHYTDINELGTAVLMEGILANPVKKMVVASSMSVYGEGLYRRQDGRLFDSLDRTDEQLSRGEWDPVDEEGIALYPVPTVETKRPDPMSVYALSKYVQERMFMMIGRAYHIPAVALRFFNAYGRRQSLSNPYTGVMAIFASRYLNGKPPVIYEDGFQKRDFVSICDLVKGCRLAYEVPEASHHVFNLGSGRSHTVRDVAEKIGAVLEMPSVTADISGEYRHGDIRHCFADITQARKVLGYDPDVSLEQGLEDLGDWLRDQIADDQTDVARKELGKRGLTL